jgi:fucose 4-O-acetylase-like acetyltransferase
VDFLRAVSITVVVLGHWLMAAPTVETGVQFTLSDMLHVAPWTQWLTWIFQVMPLFFVVGGYANAASWSAARARQVDYAAWVSRRLQRLVRPLVPFLLVWCALALVARWVGIARRVVESGSRAAFVPTWFLAVYLLVVVLAPAMHAWWRRAGMQSFWALAAGAAAVDGVARATEWDTLRWLNYGFVWLALHQLGYAWRDGVFAEPSRALGHALAGAVSLLALVGLASYPVSMVTVPGETAANSAPPTLALLALGLTHAGGAMAVETRMRAFVARASVWTATVFVNGMIMTLYLWHATVMVFLVALAEWPSGLGLRFVPNTAAWWATRVPWLLVLLAGLALFAAIFARSETSFRPRVPMPAWRSVLGAVLLCAGLVALGVEGIAGEGPLGVRTAPLLLTFAGIASVTAKLRRE